MMGIGWMYEARWLSHVDIFRGEAMKKCIFNIKLTYNPPKGDSYGKNSANCSRLHHGTVSFAEVNPRLLVKTFGD